MFRRKELKIVSLIKEKLELLSYQRTEISEGRISPGIRKSFHNYKHNLSSRVLRPMARPCAGVQDLARLSLNGSPSNPSRQGSENPAEEEVGGG